MQKEQKGDGKQARALSGGAPILSSPPARRTHTPSQIKLAKRLHLPTVKLSGDVPRWKKAHPGSASSLFFCCPKAAKKAAGDVREEGTRVGRRGTDGPG